MNKQQLAFQAKMKQKEYDEQVQAVRELELKARFWEAQWKIRFYTLEAESLQKPYDEYVATQREKNEKAMKEYQEMLDKISEQQKLKVDENGNSVGVHVDEYNNIDPDTIPEELPTVDIENN